jgi:hypothetical protein
MLHFIGKLNAFTILMFRSNVAGFKSESSDRESQSKSRPLLIMDNRIATM